MGVAAEVVPADHVRARAIAWGERLAAGPPLAVRATKMAVNQQVKQALLTSFDFSMAAEMTTFFSSDHKEALAATADKREPRFEGR
jgi:enoyl-CoA hydratase/carnithine racemase